MSVLQSAGALDAESNALLPLGETAAAVRGANELWLTLTFTRDATYALKPPQLAAACGALVSEGMKTRNKQISRCELRLITSKITPFFKFFWAFQAALLSSTCSGMVSFLWSHASK
jgi:superfamily II RNA helicase